MHRDDPDNQCTFCGRRGHRASSCPARTAKTTENQRMEHMKYVGPREDLLGHSALVRRDPRTPNVVLAQFDFPVGGPAEPEPIPHCLGWHAFAPSEFISTADVGNEVVAL